MERCAAWLGKMRRAWRACLFDRTETTDQITSGKLVLSDRTIIPFGELPDDGRRGLEIRWRPRRLEWLAVIATGVKQGTESAGLSEIAVYTAATSR
jgi:hypothetical protein